MIFCDANDANEFGAPVVRLLVTALGRVPGSADLAPLVTRLRAGEGLADLAKSVAGSDEFLARHGPAGAVDQHYVRALYWAVDGADPAPGQMADVFGQQGVTRESLLLEVSCSSRAQRGIDLIAHLYPHGLPPEDDVAYQLWLEAYPRDPAELAAAARHAARLPPHHFTLFMRVPPVRPDLVEETVDSLCRQLWPHWACVLLCADLPPRARAAVDRLAAKIAGVRVVTMGKDAEVAIKVNQALAQDTAAMFGMIEAGDRLAPHALAEAARLLAARPETVLIYTDEDRIGGDGQRHDPSFKPDFSLDLLFAGDSLGQLALFGRDAALQAGGLSPAAAPFIAYALALRLSHAAPGQIRHIPKLLFHRGRLKTAAAAKFPAQRATTEATGLARIIADHLAAHEPALALGERQQGHLYWPVLTATVPEPAPRVSIIIPIRDRPDLLQLCLQGLLNETDYPDIEILIVDNGSVEAATMQLLQRARHDPRVQVLHRPGAFNWSALNNQAAAAATGAILLFLNNDIEVMAPDWLRVLAGHVMRDGVGVVGPRLLFPDGGLQHGGILLGPRANAVHALTHSRDSGGYLGQVSLGRDLSAVTGACLAIRAAVFTALDGFREDLAVTWGDVDLCLRVREAGLRVLWLPAATLKHHEMATRGGDAEMGAQIRHEVERAVARRRSFLAMEQDPFLNPNLTATATSIVLATPPRRHVNEPELANADE
jgi:GT2 family glycosyltransferase